MKANISEFSFGYALTDELVHWHRTALTAAPVFPSLIAEGRPGGGFDLRLDRRAGVPLFLQFKLSDCMVRKRALEARSGMVCPFYRMHLRPRCHSNQHQMLLDLEMDGNDVYYTAPAFHQPEELNDAYFAHQVCARSLFIRPSSIGPLPDNGNHHVAFSRGFALSRGRLVLLCSKPKPIEQSCGFAVVEEQLEARLNAAGQTPLSDRLPTLAKTLEQVAQQNGQGVDRRFEELLHANSPLERVAFLASIYFDLRFFLVTRRAKGIG